jgi:hypothetical protein
MTNTRVPHSNTPDKEEASEALRGGQRPILPTLPAKKMTGGCETPQATTNHGRTSHKSDQLTTEGREAHAKKATTGTRRVRGGVRIEHLVFLC